MRGLSGFAGCLGREWQKTGMHDKRTIDELRRLHGEGAPCCTVTIVDAKGSIPQEIGATAIFGRQGLIHGTVGGGQLESRCADQAATLLEPGADAPTRFERLNLHRDLNMTCAGEVALYYRVYRPDQGWRIVVFGAGHIAQALCRFLVELDCEVTCVDTRADWLDKLPRRPRLQRRLVGDFVEGIDLVTDGTAVVVMTMGHATDLPIVEAIERQGCALSYLGVLGSDSKAAIMRRQLRDGGLSEDFIARIVCPIGEKIGNNTPPEIAVGVLSQLVRLRRRTSSP